MKLTENFSLQEFINSKTAEQLKIDNTPNNECIKQLTKLAETLQQIRDKYQQPIIISSGYRSFKLNKVVGGVYNSDHCFGSAVDIHSVVNSCKENKKLFELIKDMCLKGEIEFRQLINEKDYTWIHFSINNSHNLTTHQIIE